MRNALPLSLYKYIKNIAEDLSFLRDIFHLFLLFRCLDPRPCVLLIDIQAVVPASPGDAAFVLVLLLAHHPAVALMEVTVPPAIDRHGAAA